MGDALPLYRFLTVFLRGNDSQNSGILFSGPGLPLGVLQMLFAKIASKKIPTCMPSRPPFSEFCSTTPYFVLSPFPPHMNFETALLKACAVFGGQTKTWAMCKAFDRACDFTKDTHWTIVSRLLRIPIMLFFVPYPRFSFQLL